MGAKLRQIQTGLWVDFHTASLFRGNETDEFIVNLTLMRWGGGLNYTKPYHHPIGTIEYPFISNVVYTILSIS